VIAYLEGRLFEKSPEFVVVTCGGVGYRIGITLKTFYVLPEEGEDVRLFISTFARESAIELYGFVDRFEREVFELLTSVSGLGPRQARNILSGIEPRALVDAILAGDVATLMAIPGIGRKRAEQIIFQLKDKLGTREEFLQQGVRDQVFSDAVMALEGLGYARSDAEAAISRARSETAGECSLEELIRRALGILAR